MLARAMASHADVDAEAPTPLQQPHDAATADEAPTPALLEALSPDRLALALRLVAERSLPLDARMRCCEVCTAWRDALAPPELWCRLDLSARALGEMLIPWTKPDTLDDDGTQFYIGSTLLSNAAARAKGGLTSLDVTDSWRERIALQPYFLDEVVASNAATLRELRLCGHAWVCCAYGSRGNVLEVHRFTELSRVAELLGAAPALSLLEADVAFECTAQHGLAPLAAALRGEPPFAPLRVRRLRVAFTQVDASECVRALAACLHESPAALAQLEHLELVHAPLDDAPALGVLTEALGVCRLPSLALLECPVLDDDGARFVAQLLSNGALAHLRVENERGRSGAGLFDAPSAHAVLSALRDSRTLRSLHVRGCAVFSPAGLAALLAALTSHPTLEELTLEVSHAPLHDAALPALGALVAADAPALTQLHVGRGMFEEEVTPLVHALAANTHLQSLSLPFLYVSPAWAREVLVPAVVSCASLQQLSCSLDKSSYTSYSEPSRAEYRLWDVLERAETLIKARGGGVCKCPEVSVRRGQCFFFWWGCWAGSGPCRVNAAPRPVQVPADNAHSSDDEEEYYSE